MNLLDEVVRLRERVDELGSQEAPFKVAGASGAFTGNLGVSGALDVGGNLTLQSRIVLTDLADGFLRLNSAGNYSNGVYTPARLRVDGGLNLGAGPTLTNEGAHVLVEGGLISAGGGGLVAARNGTQDNGIFIFAGNTDNTIASANAGWSAYTPLDLYASVIRTNSPLQVGGTLYTVGDVGLGVAVAATYRLFVRAETSTSGSYATVMQTAGGSNLFYLRADGYSWVNSAWYIGSDRRLKEDIADLGDELVKVRRVRWRRYTRKLGGALEFGVVAQELKEIYPELVVSHTPPGASEPELAVNYQGLAVLQGRAIQQLDEELDQTRKQAKQRIDALELALAALADRVASLERA